MRPLRSGVSLERMKVWWSVSMNYCVQGCERAKRNLGIYLLNHQATHGVANKYYRGLVLAISASVRGVILVLITHALVFSDGR